jgi:BirA family transcriptional regulator, biotin operon repressor / biotin---[acetyl-CoA-carboxylase] ligase
VTAAPSPRPPLDVARLGVLAPGLRVEVVAAAPSTNALVAERAREGVAEGLVVVAEHQTAGRGRLDRAWKTPARAALTFSVLLRPTLAAAQWPWLPLLTGLAVGGTLREVGFDAGLKWPNDVLVGDRKVAGILLERVESPAGPAAVVGVGLNVDTSAAELPVESATSLALEGEAPDRTDLLAALLRRLWREYAAWQGGGADELRASYARTCVTVGRDVRVALPGGDALTGRATGIDAGGRLTVRAAGGETAVGAGDVVHVRAAGR